MKPSKSIFAFCLFQFIIYGTVSGETIISDKDEKISVKCECVVDFAFCESKVFDAIAGQQRQLWYQDNYLKKGVAADLNDACYRKRDVSNHGDGLCCSFAGDERKTIDNLFRGTRQ